MFSRSMTDHFVARSGFGVNTYTLINDAGERTFVKFHLVPELGVHSLVWDEALKLNGQDPGKNVISSCDLCGLIDVSSSPFIPKTSTGRISTRQLIMEPTRRGRSVFRCSQSRNRMPSTLTSSTRPKFGQRTSCLFRSSANLFLTAQLTSISRRRSRWHFAQVTSVCGGITWSQLTLLADRYCSPWHWLLGRPPVARPSLLVPRYPTHPPWHKLGGGVYLPVSA